MMLKIHTQLWMKPDASCTLKLFYISLIKKESFNIYSHFKLRQNKYIKDIPRQKKNPPFSLLSQGRKNVNVRKIFPLNISSVH